MARLSARITRLEGTRQPPAKGIGMDDLSPEIRAAMAAACADFQDCETPDPDTYFQAIVARMNEGQRVGRGLEALEAGDLAAIVAAHDMVRA